MIGAGCVLLAVTALLLGNHVVGSAAEPPAAALAEQLATGEFAPAIAAVGQMEGGARDAALGQIAAAQRAAGARGAAIATAAEITDPSQRTAAMREIRDQPAGVLGAGGGSQADFDSLITLIESTVAPTSWTTVGGAGSVKGFEGGVFVDATGMLQPLVKTERGGLLAATRLAAEKPSAKTSDDARRKSTLRKVSLARLQQQLDQRLAERKSPTETMRYLAGLQRIQYVLLYPESRDIVLAGPAGDWQEAGEDRVVSTDNGHPVMQLDDLVVVLRHMLTSRSTRFGCSINPTAKGLTQLKAFVEESNKRPLAPGQSGTWSKRLAEQLGPQDIIVYGIDPRTRVGRVLVEADYRMKRVGLGLEESVLEVPSYLSTIKLGANGKPPALDVLRWWFTLNYHAVRTTLARDVYELRGPGVKVLSENEFLTATGQRVHTGQSSEQNQRFASDFTANFAALARKYPIYAELQNVFDLALVGGILQAESGPQRSGWQPTTLVDPAAYQVALQPAPKMVNTVVNHRVLGRIHIVAAVSGGVTVDTSGLVKREAIEVAANVRPVSESIPMPKQLPRDAWWWD